MWLKKMIFGPGKDADSSEESRKAAYGSAKAAGQKAARFLRLDRFGAWVSAKAEEKPKAFYCCVFGLILLLLANSAVSLGCAFSAASGRAAVQAQRERIATAIKERRKSKSAASPLSVSDEAQDPASAQPGDGTDTEKTTNKP